MFLDMFSLFQKMICLIKRYCEVVFSSKIIHTQNVVSLICLSVFSGVTCKVMHYYVTYRTYTYP